MTKIRRFITRSPTVGTVIYVDKRRRAERFATIVNVSVSVLIAGLIVTVMLLSALNTPRLE